MKYEYGAPVFIEAVQQIEEKPLRIGELEAFLLRRRDDGIGHVFDEHFAMLARLLSVIVGVVDAYGVEPWPEAVGSDVRKPPMHCREDVLEDVVEITVGDAEIAKSPPDVPSVRGHDVAYAESVAGFASAF
ncbi:MAG: hypothetical protein K0S65_3182 [Labilithrix sp.]|nr:hypothetical protein [Labilithrix sp.]